MPGVDVRDNTLLIAVSPSRLSLHDSDEQNFQRRNVRIAFLGGGVFDPHLPSRWAVYRRVVYGTTCNFDR